MNVFEIKNKLFEYLIMVIIKTFNFIYKFSLLKFINDIIYKLVVFLASKDKEDYDDMVNKIHLPESQLNNMYAKERLAIERHRDMRKFHHGLILIIEVLIVTIIVRLYHIR